MLQVVHTTCSQDKQLGQSSSEIQFSTISGDVLPTPSLFIVCFAMRPCWALEFRSHAATFTGSRLLLVTTVHVRACVGWQMLAGQRCQQDINTCLLERKCYCKQEHEDEPSNETPDSPRSILEAEHKSLAELLAKGLCELSRSASLGLPGE